MYFKCENYISQKRARLVLHLMELKFKLRKNKTKKGAMATPKFLLAMGFLPKYVLFLSFELFFVH